MQTKNLFSTTLTLLLLTTQLNNNAMIVSQKQSPLLIRRHQSTNNNVINKIAPYDHKRDEQIVTHITSQYLSLLISDVTPHNRDETIQEIMNTINSNKAISKVYLQNEKPIGFINYYINQPWIIANNITIKSNAHINFLAIKSEYHNRGISATLLQHAFGPTIGIKKSSAQITENYTKQDLLNSLVMCVVNFPPRQIGPFISEVLTLGVPSDNNTVILIRPDHNVPLGGKLY